MRLANRQISREDCLELLSRCDHGVLSLCGKDGMPYGVPLNYIFHEGRIYFHCAAEGFKLDLIRENPKVSFCVIGKAEVIPQKWTTSYESVIISGTARILETREEKYPPMLALCKKISEEFLDQLMCMKGDLRSMGMVEIEIAEMTGKRSRL